MALFGIFQERYDQMPASGGGIAQGLISDPPFSGPDNRPAALAALIGQPGFDDGMRNIGQHLVEQHRANWLMNRILSDRGRVVAAYLTLDLYFTDPARRGFTIAQLRNEAARHGFASPGRMTAWAASQRLFGLLAVAGHGRPQRLVPTPKFLTLVRGRMGMVYQSISRFHPMPDFTSATLDRDAVLGAIVARFAAHYPGGQRVMVVTPELDAFADREAGVVMLLSVMLKDQGGAPIMIADLAREFQV
ncbi:MAG: hypothetical protein H7251_16125 [Acetobacteraceae bacterium]|nr:hypothetical protein [Acetobacteraceae bacterium]